MARIEVWQHVYLRLGREQSPNGFEGHQTLCYTQPGLSADAAREIEKHLLSFPVESAPGAKQAFFILPDGRPAVSNMARLPEPDRHGRACYLAHTAVVPRAVFDSAGMDPFGLFNAIPFLASVREAVACLDSHGAHPPGRAGNTCPVPPVMTQGAYAQPYPLYRGHGKTLLPVAASAHGRQGAPGQPALTDPQPRIMSGW